MQWLDITSTKSQDLTWKYSKNYEKKKFLDPPGFEPGTFRLLDLHATKELQILVVYDRNFLWYFNKTACVQKISAVLTSQSWELEKK